MTRWPMPLIIVLALSGCASLRDTPQQAYVREKGRICDARVPFWKMERVEADGRYWVQGATNAPPGKHDYFACMQEQFAKEPYREWLFERRGAAPDTSATPSSARVTSPVSGPSTAAGPSIPTAAIEAAPKPRWEIGDEWSYRWESPRGKGTFVWAVDRLETIDGIESVVIKSGEREVFYRRDDGALHLEKLRGGVELRFRPPMTIVAWPAEVGKQWTTEYTRDNVTARQSDDMLLDCTIDRMESIDVPAGTFRTFHVICVNRRTKSLSYEWWYAPEVGNMVKERTNFSYGIRERELLRFKRTENR